MRTPAALLLMFFLTSSVWAGDNWPDFRGPTLDGRSGATALPLHWSETTNIKWKTPIPGRGWSSPVVWADHIWMTTATKDGREMFAVCVSYSTGKILHHKKVLENENPEKIHSFNSYASPSPVIELNRLYVHFGTFGTACLDTQTCDILWTRRDLNCQHLRGPGSSPLLFGDHLILQLDGYDVQFVVALDKKTGDTAWKKHRSIEFPKPDVDFPMAYDTPIIIEVNNQPQVVSTGSQASMAYDPHTGRELWKVLYPGHASVSRPVAGLGMVFINTGYIKPELWALRPDGRGDVTDSHIVWKQNKNICIKTSPVLAEYLIYLVTDGGIASCIEAKNGEVVWHKSIGGQYSASPIYAKGHIYFFSQKGKTTVIKAGRKYQVLSINNLDEGFMASPAVVNKSLILRTKTHLYRVEE